MHRTFKAIDKSQADGVQTVSLAGYERASSRQVQVDVSDTPSAGTLDVSIRTPGATGYVSIGTIDLVDGPLAATFEAFCDSIQLTPTGFDADKTYSAYVFSLQV